MGCLKLTYHKEAKLKVIGSKKELTLKSCVKNTRKQTEYLPFGETLVEEHLNSNNSPYLFNAYELDRETGNYYVSARYYSPKENLWLSVDPLAEQAPDWTPYRYGFNNPVRYTDPTGMFEDDGDYYDKNGNWVYNDGIDDQRVYQEAILPSFSPEIDGLDDNVIFEYIGQVSDVFQTWDPVTNKRIEGLHPAIRMKATNFINETEENLGIQLRISTGFRSDTEQESLYWQSRDGSGRQWATDARAGQSYHNYGLAIDVVEISNGLANWNTNWTGISQIGKSHGFKWGGDWTKNVDRPHFEMSFGNSTQLLSQKPVRVMDS